MKILLSMVLAFSSLFIQIANAQEREKNESVVRIQSDGWELVGDFQVSAGDTQRPAVLMLNKADGDRAVYRELAQHLEDRGIASLRLDLRGHGESTNLGRFVPGQQSPNPMIWDAERDVISTLEFLRSQPSINGDLIGIVGASYSGEEMAEAGRLIGYPKAYVALSPGSFSDESINDIDRSGVAWLFVASNNERFLSEIAASVRENSLTAEVIFAPGTEHGTNILVAHPGFSERIAVWLNHQLQ